MRLAQRFLPGVLTALAAMAAAAPHGSTRAETNVALGKPTAGDTAFGFPTSNGNDGNVDTFTHADNTLPAPDNPFWIVDLEGSHDLVRIEIVDRGDGCCSPNRLEGARIQVFDESENPIGPALVIAGLADPSSGQMLAFNNGGAGWRGAAFVRVDGTNQYFQFAELRAIADDAGPPAGSVNIAAGRPVTSTGPTWSGLAITNLTDGNPATFTHPLASSGTDGYHFQVDLGRETALDRIVLFNRGDGCCPERLSRYRVSVLGDAGGSPGEVAWSADLRMDGSHSGVGGSDEIRADLDPDGAFSGRYLRVENISGAPYNPQIAEIEAYPAPLPAIARFLTSHGNITATGAPGLPDSATLSWRVSNFTSLTLTPGGIPLDGPEGMLVVSPTTTTTYTLTAANGSGATTATVTVGVDEPTRPPELTEFLADGRSSLADDDGDASDWIEIHNPNPFDLDAGGYFLTDDPTDPGKWRIPPILIPAGGHLVVFASGKDRNDPSAPLHTNFRLDAAGEFVGLFDRDGSSLLGSFPSDFPVSATFPPQRTDASYGRGNDGTTGFFMPPTPGAANPAALAGFVADTTFSVDRGIHDAPVDVAITTATEGATIRFTVDGSEPTATRGTVYSGPVRIARTTVLRAAAFRPGFVPTNVDTHTYIFPDDVIASGVMDPGITRDPAYAPQMHGALTDLPSVSLVTTSPVNGTTEIKASVEFIQPDGADGFQEDCGIKHFGGAFTNFDKKNFRLYFRSEFGTPKLRFPLFDGFEHAVTPVREFDQLSLRSGSHDMNQRGFYMSNRFTDDTMLEMGNINPHGRFVHVYLNGTYWGQYHLRERWNADMLSNYLGGTKEDYEAINGNWNVGGWAEPGDPYDGDGSAWSRIKSLRGDYEAVRPYLDVPHYIDYMLVFMFGDSEDEYRCAGPTGPGSGFKWFLNDADGWLRSSAGNRTSRGTPGRSAGDGPGSLFSMLYAEGHPDYRSLLADRIHRHLFNEGALTPARNAARLNQRSGEIERAFIAESARWGYRSPTSWRNARDAILSGWFPSRTAAVVSQFRNAGFYPSLDAPVFSRHGGDVPSGFNLTMSAPRGTIYYTLDGTDPRLPGGGVSPSAVVFAGVATDTVIAEGADWRFLDTGADLGTSAVVAGQPGYSAAHWKHPDFDDSSWSAGPAELGYGENDEATIVSYGPDDARKFTTTYFRTDFRLDDPGSVAAANLRLKRDDGAIVYLNGAEIVRSSMPAGTVASTTFANAAPDDGNSFESFPVPTSLLQDGRNVIAVELHQASANSSDLSFDLALSVSRTSASDLALERNAWVRSRAHDNGSWSALNEAFFTTGGSRPVEPGDLALTEVQFNPGGPDEDTEFLELANVSDHAVNLRACRFSDGIEFVFPDTFDTPLAPGDRIILVADIHAFQQRYGLDVPIAGRFFGSLDNAGESLAMESADGTEIVAMTYSDRAPWPAEADGSGRSLVLIAPAAGVDHSDPANWRASTAPGGTPAGSDGIAFTGMPDEDRDRDGLTAFLEYALGTSDTIPGTAPLRFRSGEDGTLLVDVDHAAHHDSAVLAIEASGDLAGWDGAHPGISFAGRKLNPDGTTTSTWSIAPEVAAGSPEFFVRVTARSR